ncbi:MAG TPA: hypothetical protein VF710_01965 [Longimicrobium sp.]|jgi:hypothetical protein
MRSRLLPGLACAALAATPIRAQGEGGFPEVHAMAFGDVVYSAGRDSANGFRLGQAVGHLNARLTSRLAFFAEISATARESSFDVEAERLIIRYDFRDELKLSAGRFHTPLGYWNAAYHHGAWLQTTVDRPEMVRFGGTLIPAHFVGFLAEGSVPASGVSYSLGVGNGRGRLLSRGGEAGDANTSLAVVASLRVRPATLRAVEVGVSAYGDRVTPADGTDSEERMYAAHLVWNPAAAEVIGEYTVITHEARQGGSLPTSSGVGYLQAGYRTRASITPYARIERTSVAADDAPFAALVPGYRAGIAGVRYDFAPLAALKAEYRRERRAEARWFDTVHLQVSFVVPSLGGGDAPAAAPHAETHP